MKNGNLTGASIAAICAVAEANLSLDRSFKKNYGSSNQAY